MEGDNFDRTPDSTDERALVGINALNLKNSKESLREPQLVRLADGKRNFVDFTERDGTIFTESGASATLVGQFSTGAFAARTERYNKDWSDVRPDDSKEMKARRDKNLDKAQEDGFLLGSYDGKNVAFLIDGIGTANGGTSTEKTGLVFDALLRGGKTLAEAFRGVHDVLLSEGGQGAVGAAISVKGDRAEILYVGDVDIFVQDVDGTIISEGVPQNLAALDYADDPENGKRSYWGSHSRGVVTVSFGGRSMFEIGMVAISKLKPGQRIILRTDGYGDNRSNHQTAKDIKFFSDPEEIVDGIHDKQMKIATLPITTIEDVEKSGKAVKVRVNVKPDNASSLVYVHGAQVEKPKLETIPLGPERSMAETVLGWANKWKSRVGAALGWNGSSDDTSN